MLLLEKAEALQEEAAELIGTQPTKNNEQKK